MSDLLRQGEMGDLTEAGMTDKGVKGRVEPDHHADSTRSNLHVEGDVVAGQRGHFIEDPPPLLRVAHSLQQGDAHGVVWDDRAHPSDQVKLGVEAAGAIDDVEVTYGLNGAVRELVEHGGDPADCDERSG